MVDEPVTGVAGQTGGGVEQIEDSQTAAAAGGVPPFTPTGAPSIVVTVQQATRAFLPVAYEELHVSAEAVGFASLPDKGYAKSEFLFSSAPVNYRVDGGDPTQGSGYL